ncbi:hypothetical protein BR10RB9215_C11032 [Brucella sp. 10RB9215]|uniref:hypothetical protein n=1 Tax=Brucella sp. 10RB9215 TaxID=1149953 RepID=UPI00090B893F|nr:hypothetical protein [Brucella sp. 10RB9215]SBW14206.1 hypothetical protein BR10RB9215_C11032 [Brucella sp. 10RB9215]
MELEWDIYEEEAQVILDADIPVAQGQAYFSSLKYRDSMYRVSGLRIFDLDTEFAYSVFGYFDLTDAIDLAMKLPPARVELDGLRLSCAQMSVVDLGELGRNYGRYRVENHLFRVEHAGLTNIPIGTLFEHWGFGIRPCDPDQTTRVEFDEYAAWRARDASAEPESIKSR